MNNSNFFRQKSIDFDYMQVKKARDLAHERVQDFSKYLSNRIKDMEFVLNTDDLSSHQEKIKSAELHILQDIFEIYETVFEKILFREDDYV